jgi:heme/copper-type cytochrome/quinol oxidase subunit 2
MIPRGRFFTVLTFFVAFSVLTWSCASSSGTASKDETAPKQNGSAAVAALAVVLVVVLAVVLLSPSGESTAEQKVQQTPLRDDVPPVRNIAIKFNLNFNFTYVTKEDEDVVRRHGVELVLARLNEDGVSDGNSFAFPNGEVTNLTLDYTLNNEGQPGNDRFSGSVVMNGWGWGYIHTFTSGQYPYSDAEKLITSLTDQVYSYLHTGWHDSRKDTNVSE